MEKSRLTRARPASAKRRARTRSARSVETARARAGASPGATVSPDSPSRLTGIGHIRRQETDRLAALATEINRLGGDAAELPDGLAIRPRPLRGGVFASYDDHRLVMAAAVLGLAVPGIEVENPATVGKTFPEFTSLWREMLEGTP